MTGFLFFVRSKTVSNDYTKLDVARRQLAVAIRLFFDGRESVSVYTLAANAWEIVDVLCRNDGVDSLSEQARENIPEGKCLKRDYVNPYRNFFKHADRDPDATLEDFSDDKNDHLLFSAVEDLIRLEQRTLYECQVFQIWYLAVYEEKIATEALERVLADVRAALPNINQLSRSEQKRMGREFLYECCNDKELIAHPKTDMAEWNRWEAQSS